MKKISTIILLFLFSVVLVSCQTDKLKNYTKEEANELGRTLFNKQIEDGLSTSYLEIYDEKEVYYNSNLEKYYNEGNNHYIIKDTLNNKQYEFNNDSNNFTFYNENTNTIDANNTTNISTFEEKYLGFQHFYFDFQYVKDYQYEIIEYFTPLNSGPFYEIRHIYKFNDEFKMSFYHLNVEYIISNITLEFQTDNKKVNYLSIIVLAKTIYNDNDAIMKLIITNQDLQKDYK